MRRHLTFDVAGSRCAATMDEAAGGTGLLIVSGGNEIRSGAHGGQAAMAAHFAGLGHPVFRYDRRGIGDSAGENGEFEESADDIAAALTAFRTAVPDMQRVLAFGNCDAASALAFFHKGLAIDGLILANPWVIESDTANKDDGEEKPAQPSAAAIRARYLARLKDPRSLIDLLTGKINLRKLAGGLSKASKSQPPSGLAARLAGALGDSTVPIRILIAKRDGTALAFMDAWKRLLFAEHRSAGNISLNETDSASHSFADDAAKAWLYAEIKGVLSEG